MTDAHDIEARLRAGPVCAQCNGSGFRRCGSGHGDVCGDCIGGQAGPPSPIELEAADEIARLRADFLRYAIHGVHAVPALQGWGCPKDNQPINGACECGLDAARARIKEKS